MPGFEKNLSQNPQADISSYLLENHYKNASEAFYLPSVFERTLSVMPETKLTKNYNSGADISDIYFSQAKSDKNFTLENFNKINFVDTAAALKNQHTNQTDAAKISKKSDYTTNLISADWLLFVLLANITLLTLVQYFSKNFLSSALEFVFYKKYNMNKNVEVKHGFNRTSFILYTFYFVNFSMLLYQAGCVFSIFQPASNPYIITTALFSALVLLRVLKSLFTYLPSYIFLFQDIDRDLSRSSDHHNFFFGILLIPIVLSVAFLRLVPAEISVLTGFLVFSVISLARIVKSILIFMRKSVSFLHLFLYLCVLEILPLLMIYLLLINLYNSELHLDIVF